MVDTAQVASPRYKFDPESRKFIPTGHTSPTRKRGSLRQRFTPEQLEKRAFSRWLIDGYAMQILAPALNQEKSVVLTDLTQIIPKASRK